MGGAGACACLCASAGVGGGVRAGACPLRPAPHTPTLAHPRPPLPPHPLPACLPADVDIVFLQNPFKFLARDSGGWDGVGWVEGGCPDGRAVSDWNTLKHARTTRP